MSTSRLQRRQFLSALTAVSVGCLATGCKEKRPPRIGVIVATMTEAVYSFMRRAMTDRMAADGVEVVWVSSGNSEAKQEQDVESMLALGVDVLILQPVNTENSGDLVHRVVSEGTPVVALDRLPGNAPVSLYVTADSRRAGRLQAELLVRELNGSGDILILEGEAGNSVAEAITRGNLEVFSEFSGIRIIARRAHRRWNRELARLTTERVLEEFGRLDGIVANNSSMAMGALAVLRERHLVGQVGLVGADADFGACLAIIDGEILGEVDKRPYELGAAAYDAALRLSRGEPVGRDDLIWNGAYETPVLLGPVRLITARNVGVEMSYRWGALSLAG
jgi:D-xylose transport system substrate-binding protein